MAFERKERMFERLWMMLRTAIADLGQPSILRDDSIPPGTPTRLRMIPQTVAIQAGHPIGDAGLVRPIWIEERADNPRNG